MSSITTIRDKSGRAVTYRARYRTPEGASRTSTFHKKVDAEDFLAKVNASKLAGGFVDRSAGLVMVASFAEEWISTRRGYDGGPLRPRTRALYSQLLSTHINPSLGTLRLRDLTPSVIRAWHSGLKGSTAPAKSYRLLRAIMETAVEDGLLAMNPCRVKGAGVERAPERPLPTGDEVWQLAAAIDERFRALVLCAAFAGLRWGELVGLQRRDVDLATRSISVARQLVEVGGQLVEGPPKTSAGVRKVALPPAVVVELRAHLDRYCGDEPESLVFVGAKGASLRRSNFNAVWTRARVKVDRPDLHLHDLRHYASTLAASAGASTKELMSRLGHSSPAAALRYQHATVERDRVIADRMNDLIEGVESRQVELRVVPG